MTPMKVSLKFQLENKQLRKLKAEARRRDCSVAQILRDLVRDARFESDASVPALGGVS